MRYFLSILFLFLLTGPLLAQVKDVVRGNYTPGFYSQKNYVKNPNCFANTRNISASGTGAITRITTGHLEGNASCQISGTAVADKVIFAMNDFEPVLKGQNCEIIFNYSGIGTKWKVYAERNSVRVGSSLQLESTYDAGDDDYDTKPAALPFPCGDLTNATTIVFEATDALPSAVTVTSLYTGKIINLSRTVHVSDKTSFTPTSSWPATFTATYKRIGDTADIEIKGELTGAPTGSLSVTLPSFLTFSGENRQSGSGVITASGFIGGAIYGGSAYLTGTNTVVVRAWNAGGSYLQHTDTSPTIPSAWTTGSQFYISIRNLKIDGWASSGSMYTTPADSFSTGTHGLTHKATAITSSDPVGTYNTYSYASSSNTKTICGTAPTTAPTKADGFLIYTRAYNAASTCGNPARVEIKIAEAGTSLPTLQIQLYKSTGKSVAGGLDSIVINTTTEQGALFKQYNEATGVLVVDTGVTHNGTTTVHTLSFTDVSSQTSGYLVINAQKMKDGVAGSFNELDYFHIRAVNNSGTQSIGSSFSNVVYASKTGDDNNALDIATGIFTSPYHSLYEVKWCQWFINAAYSSGQRVFSIVNTTALGGVYNNLWTAGTTGSFEANNCGEATVELAIGETLSLSLLNERGSTALSSTRGNWLTITRKPGQFR